MKKEYLDFLYELRSLIKAEVERLSELNKAPAYKCCDNMAYQNEARAALEARRSQLSGIDDCIKEYLIIHNK